MSTFVVRIQENLLFHSYSPASLLQFVDEKVFRFKFKIVFQSFFPENSQANVKKNEPRWVDDFPSTLNIIIRKFTTLR